jgi:hypothetical protein
MVTGKSRMLPALVMTQQPFGLHRLAALTVFCTRLSLVRLKAVRRLMTCMEACEAGGRMWRIETAVDTSLQDTVASSSSSSCRSYVTLHHSHIYFHSAESPFLTSHSIAQLDISLSYIVSDCSLLSLVWKLKGVLWDHLMCVYVCVP